MIALGVLLGLLLIYLALRAWGRDSTRQRARRGRYTMLAQASRAATLDDCPAEFLAILHDRLAEAEDGDEIPREFSGRP